MFDLIFRKGKKVWGEKGGGSIEDYRLGQFETVLCFRRFDLLYLLRYDWLGGSLICLHFKHDTLMHRVFFQKKNYGFYFISWAVFGGGGGVCVVFLFLIRFSSNPSNGSPGQ